MRSCIKVLLKLLICTCYKNGETLGGGFRLPLTSILAEPCWAFKSQLMTPFSFSWSLKRGCNHQTLVSSLFATLITHHVIILHKMGIPFFGASTFPIKLPSPQLLTSPVLSSISHELHVQTSGRYDVWRELKSVIGLKTDLFNQRLFSCENST